MYNGGYQIVDLGLVDLVNEANTSVSKGVYSKFESTKKPILLSGIILDGQEMHNVFIQPYVNNSNYEFTMYNYDCVLTAEDVLTVTKKTT